MAGCAIYTLNQGGFLTPHVRASHEAAAERWGCDYRVLTAWPGERDDTFGGKLELHLLEGDRCCWLDADVLIRHDCPSLFDVVPETHFGAVACDQGDTMDGRANIVMDRYVHSAYRFFRVPFDIPMGEYINGGVLVWSRPHAALWEWLHAKMEPGVVGPMVEQTALNIGIRACGVPLHILPREFNRLGRETWELNGRMKAFVHHWARWNDYRGDKAAAMNAVDWRI